METVEEFSRWVDGRKGRLLLYRGLANAKWQVESAAYRRIKEPEGTPEIPGVFKNYISQLLDTARMRGFRAHKGRMLSDLELLARLQHFGAATCLIDFTRSPLVALWFACHEQLEQGVAQDGKVIAMDTTETDTTISGLDEKSQLQSGFRIVSLEQIENKIQEFLDSKTLWKWEPTLQESRVIAQRSIFVFGQEMIQNDRYEAAYIPASAKKSILRALHEKFGINEAGLFSDFAGFALANAHEKPYEEYSADDYHELAESYHQRDNVEKAMQYCDKAIAKNSEHAEAHYLRGRCNSALKNWEESVKDFSRTVAINPADFTSFLMRGTAYEYMLGKPKEAMNDYTEAIKILSKDEEKYPASYTIAYHSRGRVRASMENHSEAIKDFDSAIKISPDSAEIYLARAQSHRALGNEGNAKVDENRANEINQPEIKQAIPTQ
ncbi:MAG: FRG domain-containing protein [Alphaproteobacteria bacterium]|nr:FRG domain-containing protein [Alphaproteobacteria bacterium]